MICLYRKKADRCSKRRRLSEGAPADMCRNWAPLLLQQGRASSWPRSTSPGPQKRLCASALERRPLAEEGLPDMDDAPEALRHMPATFEPECLVPE